MRKKTDYRLEPLLRIKERARKNAELALARALQRLEKEKKRLEQLKKEKEAIIEKKKKARRELHERMISGEAVIGDSRVHGNYLKRLDEDRKKKEEEIERQHEVIEEAKKQVARARRDYIDAARELNVMEKHKELWRKRQQRALEREEEKEMDELGNVIHGLRKAG